MKCDYHTVEMEKLSTKERYFLMTGCIVPRPIAWVTSYNRDRTVLNLAPFSYFNGVSSKPPLIMLGLGAKKDGDQLINKDTTNNILETKEFVVHIPTVDNAERVEYSSKSFPESESEVENLGLKTIDSEKVSVPRLKETPIQMECRLYQSINIPPVNSHLILGEVLMIHISSEYWKDERVDVEKLNPLARLDGGTYGELGKRFRVTET